MKKYKLTLPSGAAKIIKYCAPVPLENLVNKNNKAVANDLAIDLLRQMLVYDKNKRITPIDAMNHPYFDIVKS